MTPTGNGTYGYGRAQTGLKLVWIQAIWAANQKNVKHNIRIQSGRQKEAGAGENRQWQRQTSLEDLVELAAQGVLEVWVEPIQGVLPQVGHFVPWVQNRLVLVCTRESQLDADAAVDRPLAFAALRPDSACLFAKADKVWLAGASTTAILLPVQVLKPAFIELKYLWKNRQVAVRFRTSLLRVQICWT